MPRRLLILGLLALCLPGCYGGCHRRPPARPVIPVPIPYPVPSPHRPWFTEEQKTEAAGDPFELANAAPIGAVQGGTIAPDGRTEIQVDLPGDMQQQNIASKGLGCCVFRSIDHAARWQNVPALIHMPEWMVAKGIEGGGYPSKVANLIPRMAKDCGLPAPKFLQVENARDLELVKLATKTGRLVNATYSRSPTGRYGGSHIEHMINIPHCDDRFLAILDNNFTNRGEKTYEWMSPEEYLRTCCEGRGFWAVILLEPPPPPAPHN